MATAWVSPQTVIDVTGVSVTEQQLALAQADIEVFARRIYDDTARLRDRDLYWLGRAVAYQAAWAVGQYDLNTRMDSNGGSQDGVSTQLADDAVVLAPRAERALRNCSWRRSRTLHVRSAIEGGAAAANALLDAADDSQTWRRAL
jgi:hypothetical protein